MPGAEAFPLPGEPRGGARRQRAPAASPGGGERGMAGRPARGRAVGQPRCRCRCCRCHGLCTPPGSLKGTAARTSRTFCRRWTPPAVPAPGRPLTPSPWHRGRAPRWHRGCPPPSPGPGAAPVSASRDPPSPCPARGDRTLYPETLWGPGGHPRGPYSHSYRVPAAPNDRTVTCSGHRRYRNRDLVQPSSLPRSA